MPELPSPRRLPLAVFLVGLSALAAPGARAQTGPAGIAGPAVAAPREEPLAVLFGVAPDSRLAALGALATRTHVDCRASSPVRTGAAGREALPVVCIPPPSRTPMPVSATYWYEDETLARAFLVATLSSPTVAEARGRFDVLHLWIAHTLGPPAQPLQLPPGWSGARPLPDTEQLSLLLAGRARLSIVWQRPEASIELWLAGEHGQLVLAVGMLSNAAGRRCTPDVVESALLDLFPPATAEERTRAAALLARCHMTRAVGALRATLAHDDDAAVKAEVSRALEQLAAAPVAATPVVAATLPRLADERDATEPKEETPRPAPPTPAPTAGAPPRTGPGMVAPPATTEPSGPISGTPLAIGASTMAGAALLRNLALMGGPQLTGVTPQLLLGSAGAVIGFGTTWGLSRFGFRPTLEQAAWYANVTAWGTLGGVAIWSVRGSDNPKLKYGLPALGEALGMGAGVWSARRWTWTMPQLVLADSLLLGASLTALGASVIEQPRPHLTISDAVVAPLAMVGAAAAARFLEPTERDLGLMTASALAAGWEGALLGAGLGRASFLGSHQSWGGAAVGLGVGYLGGAAAGAFTEVAPSTLGVGAAGILAGNVLGLGLQLTIQGFARGDAETPGAAFTPDELHARATSAAVGGLLLAGVGVAAAPHLHLGPSATSMTLTGILYGAGTWWLASEASYHGQPVTAVAEARLEGGLLTGAALGGLAGLVASRWFAPDGEEQAQTLLAAGLGMGAGLGLAKLTTSTKGTPDALGVLFGAGAGFAGGALTARALELRAPDLGAGTLGLATGLLIGELVPTLRWDRWQDSRVTAGSTLLGMSLGAGAGIALAHPTNATGGEVGVATTAGGLGVLAGLGLGYAQPCGLVEPCTSRAPRVGALVGGLSLMGGAIALEPELHLATTLGPDAGKLAFLGGTFGFADGLMLAGVLDPRGVISGTTPRGAWGGILFGTSVETGAGLVASKYVRLHDGDRLFLAGGKISGGLFGLGAAMLVRDHTGTHDTLATLAGSMGGLAAATAAQMYTPLGGTDGGAAAAGAVFGAFVGALVPTLDEPRWQGLDHRKTGGGLLLGLSGGAIAGAAVSHATDASSRALGLTIAGGVDGLASGLGLGLLLSNDASSRPTRVGVVAGAEAGLALGGLAWPRLTLGPGDASMITLATTLGAWTGVWVPTLGHASTSDVSAAKTWGGLLAGGGFASIGASLLAPELEVDGDLLFDAVAVDALWTAAGAGAGALVSTRDDAPVWGMLGAGTAGLLFGGALHRSIEVGEAEGPLLALAAGEGAWLGGWAPYLLHTRSAVTERQRAGALPVGGFGAAGVATLVSGAFELSPARAGYGGLGSALGASLGGGVALLSPSLHDQRGVGLMLGGTMLGLGAGVGLAPRLGTESTSRLLGGATAGAALGASESLLFAWSGRAEGQQQYGGAALVGGGLGASLGLAAAATPSSDRGSAPATAGFAAWGAFSGSLAGSLVGTDPHEIVFGGLIGANAGFLAGYALMRSEIVDPRDFGWLSLFGALGTVAGAGAGAAVSAGSSAPIRAGLAAGPATGMLVGALVLPRLRRSLTPSGPTASASTAPRDPDASAPEGGGAHAGARHAERGVGTGAGSDSDGSSLSRRLAQVGTVTDWQPLVGALPVSPDGGPAPVLFGLTGHWK
ncbi:MAG TPA: hypothetical protein VMT47_19305 [Polyangia bacterium]|nr:hypothetical protein [Polyangia bacterium]